MSAKIQGRHFLREKSPCGNAPQHSTGFGVGGGVGYGGGNKRSLWGTVKAQPLYRYKIDTDVCYRCTISLSQGDGNLLLAHTHRV